MTASSVEKKVNGTPVASPELGEGRPQPVEDQRTPAPSIAPSRQEEKRRSIKTSRAEKRADKAQRAEERRRNTEHKQKLKHDAKQAKAERTEKARAEREKLRARRRKERRATWQRIQTRLAHHMPVWGLPVVAVSLVMGWSGQAGAAAHLGMGIAAVGVPVLTEGMVLTFAGLTGQAIDKGRPYKSLMRITWVTTVIAATINGAGHLIEDDSLPGMYRAGAYALASLAAMILWWVVMRSKRAAISGKTAEEIARWRRLGRRHPILMRRARRVSDNTGVLLPAAWAKVWERANGAAPGEPSIREIRASRRAAHRRRVAQAWDGQRSLRKRPEVPAAAVPASKADAPGGRESDGSNGARTPVQPPFLPVALLVPGGQGGWVEHPVPVLPMPSPKRFRTDSDRKAATRFPQGKDAVSKRVRKSVEDSRLAAVRKLVMEAAKRNQDLRKHPSNRATAKAVGCRPGTARELLRTVLAEHGITR
ncbi:MULTISPECIES: hypothetical protein [Streptomyces]|uniref:DUF2637 domain-containing protein n=1 Tax=Streptomyces venezuelae TaxID=54571 RepID=A0A5P2BBZ7_STRVZ|nr:MULTISPECIES: hypothetical protein [Streptomyces]NDZ98527.1 hypothetical protein [Streptomyces sp. SID10116]MYY79746.1 hypothetical protein [Streptomyces sp. SID335]MYZ16550.1 hypothetical protein [Streptomyces sp. SID337]NDZ84517.1 hypothetical protein [Streptomyces sp. SID10115]NEB43480.1 hypothetical protein [Streptomyces sp. SID339]